MKKIFFSLFASILCHHAVNAQITAAPEVGLNMATMRLTTNTGTISTKFKAGVTGGGMVDIPVMNRLSVQPGVFYMMNGTTYSTGDNHITVHTIQVPVNVQYRIGREEGLRFFVGIGPYVGLNLGGNTDFSGVKTSLVISSDTGASNLKALDVGAGLNVGVILANNFYARVRYQMGFLNMQPEGNANNSVTSSSFGITVGYYFFVTGRYKKHGPLKYDKIR